MSYSEYVDMFYETQKKECPYRAFTFDVINSRNQQEYLETKSKKYFYFLNYIYSLLELEEQKTGKQILLKDKFNHKYILKKEKNNCNNYNPMLLGDMVTYFVYNGSISTQRMLEIFVDGLRKCNINYSFHFNTGVYETNNYADGGIKMYKGYMPQILENLSKKTKINISRDSLNSKEL